MTTRSLPFASDNKFARIATPYPKELIRLMGYKGESDYVGVWIVAETDTLYWFDGKYGVAAEFDGPWQAWTTQRDVKFALRNLQLKSDFTDRGFALIFAQPENEIYVGKLVHVREKLGELADVQGLVGPLENLFSPQELDVASKRGFTDEQMTALARFETGGSTKPVRH